MEGIASKNKIKMDAAVGVFTNSETNVNSLVLPGATYGFCVRLSPDQRHNVFKESQNFRTNRFVEISCWSSIQDDIYPLYWGKDKMLGARIHQHLKNTQTTGLARLCAYTSLHGKEIACVALTVSKYAELELALQRDRPHLLKAVTRVL